MGERRGYASEVTAVGVGARALVCSGNSSTCVCMGGRVVEDECHGGDVTVHAHTKYNRMRNISHNGIAWRSPSCAALRRDISSNLLHISDTQITG